MSLRPATSLLLAGLAGQVLAGEAFPALVVNGVRIEVTPLTGRDVAAQVAALELRWQGQGQAVLPWLERGGWRLLSHRDGRWNEVLQLRTGGAATEAWLSRVDTQRPPASVPVLPLPPDCHARTTVESQAAGERVIQVTGTCSAPVLGNASGWADHLAASGWLGGVQADPRVYRFRRGRDELTVLLGLAATSAPRSVNGFTALQVHATKEIP